MEEVMGYLSAQLTHHNFHRLHHLHLHLHVGRVEVTGIC
jgi:hypothetical protein